MPEYFTAFLCDVDILQNATCWTLAGTRDRHNAHFLKQKTLDGTVILDTILRLNNLIFEDDVVAEDIAMIKTATAMQSQIWRFVHQGGVTVLSDDHDGHDNGDDHDDDVDHDRHDHHDNFIDDHDYDHTLVRTILSLSQIVKPQLRNALI